MIYILLTWDGSGTLNFYISDSVPFGSESRNYTVNPFTIVITIIVILMIVSAVLGIQVFGSGLQDSSVRFMLGALTKILVYTILSLFTYGILSLIGSFGEIIYWIITFMFAAGLLESMFNFSGGND